jgi:hypothetical protein
MAAAEVAMAEEAMLLLATRRRPTLLLRMLQRAGPLLVWDRSVTVLARHPPGSRTSVPLPAFGRVRSGPSIMSTLIAAATTAIPTETTTRDTSDRDTTRSC